MANNPRPTDPAVLAMIQAGHPKCAVILAAVSNAGWANLLNLAVMMLTLLNNDRVLALFF